MASPQRFFAPALLRRIGFASGAAVAAATLALGGAAPVFATAGNMTSIAWEDGVSPVRYGSSEFWFDVNGDSNSTGFFNGCYSITRNGVRDFRQSYTDWQGNTSGVIVATTQPETVAFELWSYPDGMVPANCDWVVGDPTFSTGIATVLPRVMQLSATTVNATVGVPMTPVTAVAAGMFDGVTFSLTPSLSAGLSFDPSTGTISGTPTAVSDTTVYTVTASAEFVEPESATVSISVALPASAAANTVSLATTGVNPWATGVCALVVTLGGVALRTRRRA